MAARADGTVPSPVGRAGAGVVAVLAAAAAVAIAVRHPLAPYWVTAITVMWGAVVWARPWLALAVLPAVLPVVDLTPWTGWLAAEEFDLLVLAAIAGGGARAAWSRDASPAASTFALATPVVVAAFFASQQIALVRGVLDAGGAIFALTDGYHGPTNALRIGKSLVLALAFYPVVAWQWRRAPELAQRALVAGLTAGLATTALAVVWERLAFTGLLNFSTDYRTTALFWEMHVGGAALDGFLALTVPFAVFAWRSATSTSARALALGALLLGAYAVLTTFSRGLYLGIAVGAVLYAWTAARQRPPAGGGTPWRRGLALGILAVATAVGAYVVFRSGGYRTLAAVAACAAGVVVVSPLARTLRHALAVALVAAGMLAGLTGVVVAVWLPKGAYIVFALFALATAGAWWGARTRAGAGPGLRVSALLGLGGMMVCAVGVGRYWGGEGAMLDAGAVVGVLAIVGWVGSVRDIPGWPRTDAELQGALAAAAVACGCVVVFVGGGYMGERFATSERDLGDRLRHWRIGVDLLDSPWDWAVGKGLGRYPGTYFFGAREGVLPGNYGVVDVEGRRALVLSSPSYPVSFGDAFRVAQRIVPEPGRYRVELEVRSRLPAEIHAEVCEKHLLYSGECAIAAGQVTAAATAGEWQRVRLDLDGSALSRGRWYAPHLAFFALFVETSSRAVEVANVSLVGPDGTERIANGNFADGMTRWFFTSDRYHLPWHFKSFPGNVLFEQGGVGVLLLLVWVAIVLGRLVLGGARLHPLAPALAGAVAGFVVVGLFDSLVDVPRVAWMFWGLLLTGGAVRAGGSLRAGREAPDMP